MQLTSLDPWSLDIIDQELEKFTLDPDQSGETLSWRLGSRNRFGRFFGRVFFERS